jgi:hypothetical protein
MPFYLDWQFWSAVVAVLALLLSQLPPVHVLLRRAALRCEVHSRMHVTHSFGNTNTQWHLIIENTGGRAVRIKRIALTFTKQGGQPFHLPAQSYLETPGAKEAVLLTPFKLRPGEDWGHIVNFFAFFSREEDKKLSMMRAAVRTDIVQKRELLVDREEVCEAQPELVSPLIDFFKSHFRLSPGEYEAKLDVITNVPRANVTQSYRFTLFESESEDLRSYVNDYKIGGGVAWTPDRHTGAILPVYET